MAFGAHCYTPVMLKGAQEPIDIKNECSLPPEENQLINSETTSQSVTKKMTSKWKAKNLLVMILGENIGKLLKCAEGRNQMETIFLDYLICTIKKL